MFLFPPCRKYLTRSSQSQAQLPTTLHLQSSSTLGTGKVSTNKARLDKLEDKETRRAIDGRAGKRKRNPDKFNILRADDDDDDDEDEDIETGGTERITAQATTGTQESVVMDSEPSASTVQPMASGSSAVGSALQRNPDGSVAATRIAKKKKQGKKVIISYYLVILCNANEYICRRLSRAGILNEVARLLQL